MTLPASSLAALPALLVLFLGPPVLASPSLPCTVPLVASLRLPSVRQQNPLWLLGCLGLLVLGELVIAPLGFAMMNRVVAPQQVGLINALWYAAVAAGFVLAGEFGPLLQLESERLWFGVLPAYR